MTSDPSYSDSDSDCHSGYWLRVPVTRPENSHPEQSTMPRGNTNVRTENNAVPEHSPDPVMPLRGNGELQRQNSDVDLFVQEPVVEEEARAEEGNGNNDIVEPDRESPPPFQLTEQTHTEVRKSTRDRRPPHFLTYDSLGEPSLQTHAAVSSVIVHPTPYWCINGGSHHSTPLHTLGPSLSPMGVSCWHPIGYTETPYFTHAYHTPMSHIPSMTQVC